MKIRKIFLIITILLSILMIHNVSLADVGSFEDYDSGSSWDSGSSSSRWDSSSSSWDSGYSYVGSSSVPINGVEVLILLILIIYIIRKSLKKTRHKINNYTPSIYSDKSIEDRIKEIDPNFSAEEFVGYVRDVFIKLQNAWTDRDWEKIRPYESKELFEQHKMQLEGYIKNNQINVMERICVNWVHLVSFEQLRGNDILKVDLNSRMGDYIIDATTKQVLKGDKTKEYYHTYTLTFIRTTGNKTPKDKTGLNTTNCPNCGAPTVITSSGRCEYCNSVITTDDYGWVLSNLSRKN